MSAEHPAAKMSITHPCRLSPRSEAEPSGKASADGRDAASSTSPAPRPYYEDDAVTIYHGDCRDFVITADVLITDPPYGVNLTTKTSDYRDSPAFDAGESLRASVLYSDDPATIRALLGDFMPKILARVDRALIFPGARMMYAYPEPRAVGGVFTSNGAGMSSWGFQCLHPILYYGSDPYLADGQGSRPNGFKDEQPNPDKFDHPCPKPLKWMRWAVVRSSRLGETVIDPFAGTGTTLRAAKDLGRKAIGIEIEERYCEIAALRMGQEVLDLAV